MSSEAIQPACLVCGGYPDLPASPRGDLAVCSPCRAEHAGAVELRLPEGARPRDQETRHFVVPRREFLPGKGALEALRQWGEALDTAARRVGLLRSLLEAGLSDPEAVAHVLLTGGAARFKLRAATGGDLALTDLPAPLARRLAEECPEIARGPALPEAELVRLAGRPDRRP